MIEEMLGRPGCDPWTIEEEREACRKLSPKKLREQLVELNLRFAWQVVTTYPQFQRLPMEDEDKFQCAALGLDKAARKFDPDQGVRFISYAIWWIRQTVLEEASQGAQTIRVPTNVIGMSSQVKALEKNNESLKEEDICEALDMSEAELERVRHSQRLEQVFALDDTTGGDVTISMKTACPNPQSDAVAMDRIQEDAVRSICDKRLSAKERDVIRSYFGLGVVPMNLKEIGKQFGVTRERIRQIRNRALKRLQRDGLLRDYYESA